MAVNPLTPVVNYQLKQSRETSEENNRNNARQENLGKQNKNKDGRPEEKFKLKKSTEEAENLEALELTSQIIDSSKVVELLSHQPKPQQLRKKNLYCSKKTDVQSQKADVKRLNKSL